MSRHGRFGRTPLLVLGAAAACVLAACSSDEGLRCEEPGEYTRSTSAPPLRVPDDLSTPREDEALRVPPVRRDGTADEEAEDGCLEQPPEYFEDGQQ